MECPTSECWTNPDSFKVPQPSYPTHYLPQLDGQNDYSSSDEEPQHQPKRAGRRERKTAKRIGNKVEERHAKHARLEGAEIEHGFASQLDDEPKTYMSDVILESGSDKELEKSEMSNTQNTTNPNKNAPARRGRFFMTVRGGSPTSKRTHAQEQGT